MTRANPGLAGSMRKTLFTAAALVLLAACGSGDEAPPPPSNPNEPNDTMTLATPVTIGSPVVGRIAAYEDVDFYVFTVPAGGATVRFQTFDAGGTQCDPSGQNVDPFLWVYEGNGAFVDGVDDGVAPFCEDLSVGLPAGQAYVMVGGNPNLGGVTSFDYTLKVTIP